MSLQEQDSQPRRRSTAAKILAACLILVMFFGVLYIFNQCNRPTQTPGKDLQPGSGSSSAP